MSNRRHQGQRMIPRERDGYSRRRLLGLHRHLYEVFLELRVVGRQGRCLIVSRNDPEERRL